MYFVWSVKDNRLNVLSRDGEFCVIFAASESSVYVFDSCLVCNVFLMDLLGLGHRVECCVNGTVANSELNPFNGNLFLI